MNLNETIRAAVNRDRRTPSAIAKAAGLNRGIVWRFVHDADRGLTLRIAEKLCRVLGLELRIVRRRAVGKGAETVRPAKK